MIDQVTQSHLVTIVKERYLGMVKSISLPIILLQMFCWSNLWATICCLSQLCEMGYNCMFTNKCVTVFRRSDSSYAFSGILREKLYLIDFILEEMELDKCLIVNTNMGWLCHRKLAYIGMRNLHKL
jgi:hypothetical protein